MKKLDGADARAFASIVAAESVQLFIKRAKASEDDSGVFSTVISSDDEDRQGESVSQDGLDFTNYMKNPVVLWGHDYYSLPIGVCLGVERKGSQTVARFRFAPAEANPFAAQCQKLWELGFQRAVSIGFIPREFDDAGNTVKAEVLEFSLVPIPANPVALNTDTVKQNSLDLALIASKGIPFRFETTAPVVGKAVVPYADHGTADESTSWDAGEQVKAAGDDLAKLKAMCAWYDASEEDKKSSYKLPHHEADGLRAVWNGVRAAMGAMAGARGGVQIPEGDRRGVISHLAKHYRAFGKDVPDVDKILAILETSTTNPAKAYLMAVKEKFDVDIKGAEVGASCQLDDGTPGVLARDPGNPGGPLVCVPIENASEKRGPKPEDDGDGDDDQDEDQSTANQQAQDLQRALEQTLEKEHGTHGVKTSKAIDEFHKSIEEFHDARDQKSMAREAEKRMKAMHDGTDDEHDRHEKACGKAIDEYTEGIQEWRSSQDDEPDGKAAEPSGDEGEDDAGAGTAKPSTPTDIVKAAEALRSDISDEHGTHRKAMHKMVDEYGKKMVGSDEPDVREKHRKAFHRAAEAEQDRHEKAIGDAVAEFRTSTQVEQGGKKSASAKMSRSARASVAEAVKHLKAATALHEEIADRHHEAKAHIKAAASALSDLQAGRANDNDEDGGPSDDGAAPSKTQRSNPAKASEGTSELDAYIEARKLTRGVSTAVNDALKSLNERISARKPQV